MANVTFRKGLEENLPTDGMAEEGCVYHATDSGNAYIGSSNGSLIPLNRSPYYGTSSTGSSTNSKVVTLDTDVFSLYQGVMITVKFANANTASSPTLNVNSTGAIAVKLYGTTAAGNTPAKSWNAGEAVTFVYDGSYWLLVGCADDTNFVHKTGDETITGEKTFEANVNLTEGASLNMVYDSQTPDGVSLQAAELNGLKTVSFSGISDDGMVQIKNVYVPTEDTDAANKYYVDEEILDIDEYRVYLACKYGPYGVH